MLTGQNDYSTGQKSRLHVFLTRRGTVGSLKATGQRHSLPKDADQSAVIVTSQCMRVEEARFVGVLGAFIQRTKLLQSINSRKEEDEEQRK